VYVTSVPPHTTPSTRPPTNYIYMDRGDKSTKGCFVIDPFLSVPRSLLPPLTADESEGDRKNVNLKSRCGTIDVEISLMGDAQDSSVEEAWLKKRTSLDINSDHGSINVKLRTCPSPSTFPMPFHLNLTGRNSSVNIWLPRTFQGPMTIYSGHGGSVKFSDDVWQHMGMCNEIDHTRHCFIGDLLLFNDEQDWKGDEVNVKTQHGGVKVRFVDEVEPETLHGIPGLLCRVFGF